MKIHFIIGCGRCGKTTLARKLADQIPGAVLIDEAQFLDVLALCAIYSECRVRGVDLILSGLEYWANGRHTALYKYISLCEQLSKDSECTASEYYIESPIVHRPINSNQFCPCGCGQHPDIDLKVDGDPGRRVDVSRELYQQVCFKEWEKVMGRRPEGR